MKKILLSSLVFSFSLSAQIPSGAIGDWPFDNNAQDMSGNGNHGIVNGAIPAPDRFGQAHNAYRFNGVNSKIVVPHNSSIDIANGVSFTFAYWQKAYPGNVDKVVLTKHESGTWNGYNFIANNQMNAGYCNTLNHLYFYAAAGAQEDACSNGPLLGDTLWHFVVGMYNATTNKTYMYVDNVLQSDVGQSSGSMPNSANLSFGYDDDTNDLFFNGVLDGVRLYKRALTPSELSLLFNEGCLQCVGIPKELGNSDDIEVYPNPSEGKFVLKSAKFSKSTRVIIYDQLSRVVFDAKVQSPLTTIETNLNTGVYFLKLISDEKPIAIKKLVIQ
jgi:hypothetical protein